MTDSGPVARTGDAAREDGSAHQNRKSFSSEPVARRAYGKSPTEAPPATATRCRGRFAPSPTGPLHFGSLVAATGSYLQARSQNGEWRVRIEDIDPQRSIPEAVPRILRTLEAFGLQWDGPVLYQSTRAGLYEQMLQQLEQQRLLYPCGCSRSEVRTVGKMGSYGPIYPGTCRNARTAGRQAALRLRTPDQAISFTDRVHGPFTQNLAREVGDFVVRRADGAFAYQLAAVADDAEQGITEVVRGADLLACTPRQIYLQQQLGLPTPRYLHLPIALDARGAKLSKQTGAKPVEPARAVATLWRVLRFLGQDPPAEVLDATLDELWRWAHQRWAPSRVPLGGHPEPADPVCGRS